MLLKVKTPRKKEKEKKDPHAYVAQRSAAGTENTLHRLSGENTLS